MKIYRRKREGLISSCKIYILKKLHLEKITPYGMVNLWENKLLKRFNCELHIKDIYTCTVYIRIKRMHSIL